MTTIALHDAHYDAFSEEMYEQNQNRMCGCFDEPPYMDGSAQSVDAQIYDEIEAQELANKNPIFVTVEDMCEDIPF